MMAGARKISRSYGKSDPFDALAVARAALQEPDLPAAQLDGSARDLRLLVDHREDPVAERTRYHQPSSLAFARSRPDLGSSPVRSFDRARGTIADAQASARWPVIGPLPARTVASQPHETLSVEVKALEAELTEKVTAKAPSFLDIPGCGGLTAAKIIGETADVRRFRSKDAFARFTGTAPLPVWSSNHPRQRLSRVGNRQLNCALHRIALTQAHWHEVARAYLQRRKDAGDTTKEALRVLKRRLSDVVYRAMITDHNGVSADCRHPELPQSPA